MTGILSRCVAWHVLRCACNGIAQILKDWLQIILLDAPQANGTCTCFVQYLVAALPQASGCVQESSHTMLCSTSLTQRLNNLVFYTGAFPASLYGVCSLPGWSFHLQHSFSEEPAKRMSTALSRYPKTAVHKKYKLVQYIPCTVLYTTRLVAKKHKSTSPFCGAFGGGRRSLF